MFGLKKENQVIPIENNNDEFGMILFCIVGCVWVKKEDRIILIEIEYMCKFRFFRHRGTGVELANKGCTIWYDR